MIAEDVLQLGICGSAGKSVRSTARPQKKQPGCEGAIPSHRLSGFGRVGLEGDLQANLQVTGGP